MLRSFVLPIVHDADDVRAVYRRSSSCFFEAPCILIFIKISRWFRNSLADSTHGEYPPMVVRLNGDATAAIFHVISAPLPESFNISMAGD